MNPSCETIQIAAMAHGDGEEASASPDEVEQHLAGCESCRVAVGQSPSVSLDSFQRAEIQIDLWPELHTKLTSGTTAVPASRDGRSGSRWRLVAWAVCASVLVVLAGVSYGVFVAVNPIARRIDPESSACLAPYSITWSPARNVSKKEYRDKIEAYFADFEARREAGTLKPLDDGALSQLTPFVLQDGLGTIYVSSEGKVEVAVRYPVGFEFSEQLAPVGTNVNQEHGIIKFGFIDRTGKLVIPGKFKETQPFSEGLAVAAIDGRYGFIDRTGAIVIEPRFWLAEPFSDGIACVRPDGDTVEFIDRTGKVLFTINAHDVGRFSEGLLYVNLPGRDGFDNGHRRGYVDHKFEFALRLGPDSSGYWPTTCEEFHGGRAAIDGISGKSNAWSFISTKGEVVIPGPFVQVLPFSEGLAAVTTESAAVPKWGYVNAEGEMVIAPQFIRAMPFSEGLAAVLIPDEGSGVPNGQWGYINAQGEVVIAPQFYQAQSFRGGCAMVSDNPWSRGLIDRTGKYVFRLDNPKN